MSRLGADFLSNEAERVRSHTVTPTPQRREQPFRTAPTLFPGTELVELGSKEMERNPLPQEKRLRLIAWHLGIAYLPAYEHKSLPSVEEMCGSVIDDGTGEHLVVCPVCGQIFDCHDRAQVNHHKTNHHEPKLFRVSSASASWGPS